MILSRLFHETTKLVRMKTPLNMIHMVWTSMGFLFINPVVMLGHGLFVYSFESDMKTEKV